MIAFEDNNPSSDSNFAERKEQELINNETPMEMEIDMNNSNGNNENLNTNLGNSEVSEFSSIIISNSKSEKHNRKSSSDKAIKHTKVSKKIQDSFDPQDMINNQEKSKIKKIHKKKANKKEREISAISPDLSDD